MTQTAAGRPGQTAERAQTVDVKRWAGYEDQVDRLFELYRKRINPLVSEYNALENSFPLGVMNELRDVFSHLTQSLQSNRGEDVTRHLDKAYRHMKRAAVDAFKYMAMAYSKVYDDFKDAYRRVDLSYIDNGRFLPEITRLNAVSERLVHEAKMIESDAAHDEDTMYAAYEKACESYQELYQRVMGAMDAAENLSLRAEQDEAARKKEHLIDRWIAIAGVLIGIAGVLFGFFF